jgi:hypothetical protein
MNGIMSANAGGGYATTLPRCLTLMVCIPHPETKPNKFCTKTR